MLIASICNSNSPFCVDGKNKFQLVLKFKFKEEILFLDYLAKYESIFFLAEKEKDGSSAI